MNKNYMMGFSVRNVNQALPLVLRYLDEYGVEEISRNGPVLVAPVPCVIGYSHPKERVLFSGVRNANPFFHLMEALWMLAGRSDVAWLQQFNSRMGEFSDDKETLWGAYGWRWRSFFGGDQLKAVIAHLREQPHSRRAVITMWSPNGDLWPYGATAGGGFYIAGKGGLECRDVPCNTHIYVSIHDGALNITVCNRSNDVIWGALGTNVVHMSLLQEYLAAHLSVAVGTYYQFSNNLHIYTDLFDKEKRKQLSDGEDDRYRYPAPDRQVTESPLLDAGEEPAELDDDLARFFGSTVERPYATRFFRDTVDPMYNVWMQRKHGPGSGLMSCEDIEAEDWRAACREWIQRREYV